MLDRYQSGFGHTGAMDTPRWFAALLSGIDGPLGSVLDVGCAEGVMCVLADEAGADSVLGIGLHDDRMAAALELTIGYPRIEIREMEAARMDERFRTVVFSMMAHWLGRDETARFARLAERNFAIVFRYANDHYQVPFNGSWFPTFDELDATVDGVRTSETLLETQADDKRIYAATYRTDIRVCDGWVERALPDHPEGLLALIAAGAPIEAAIVDGRLRIPLYEGFDRHGDEPFRPRHGLPPARHPAVDDLASGIARAALYTGWLPLDFSPRNVIVGRQGAHLIDLGEIAQTDGTVPDEYRSVWERTLGRPFSGRLDDLL